MNYLSLLAALCHAGPERGHVLTWVIPEAEQRKLIARIRQASWRLTPEDRAILVARFRDGLTFDQLTPRSRERNRQLLYRALHRLRDHLVLSAKAPAWQLYAELRAAIGQEPIPGDVADPAWLSTCQAAHLTALCPDHLRLLARTGRVAWRPHPVLGGRIQLSRESLHEYVLGHGMCGRRRKGIWREC
jgi:hypothetical protein